MWEKNNYDIKWCKKNFVSEKALNEAYEIRTMLFQKMDQNKIEVLSAGMNIERIQKAICAGFAQNLAKKCTSGFLKPIISYQVLSDDEKAFIHQSSSLASSTPQW